MQAVAVEVFIQELKAQVALAVVVEVMVAQEIP
jgi:hypothetical protein